MTSAKKPTILPVLLVNFIGMLGYSIIIPMLVFLVRKFGGNEVMYGLLGATYPFFQLIGAPILGRWSDQIGRRKVLLLSQIGTFFAWVLFVVALMLPVMPLAEWDLTGLGSFTLTLPLVIMFAARALDGITGGNVSVANAYLSDISDDATRKGNFGKMASSTSLGFIIGPLLASALGGTAYAELLPVMAAATISLIAIFVIFRFLPESKQTLVAPDAKPLPVAKLFQIEHKECYEMEKCPDTGLWVILQTPGIRLLFLIYFLTFLGFSFFYAGFPIYATGALGWGPGKLGLFFTLTSGIMVLVQGPLLSYLSDKIADGWLVIIGSLMISVNFFLLPIGEPVWVYTANVLLATGNGLMWPSFLSILSRMGTGDTQGTIQGYANSVGSLASILGLVLGGTLFGQLGPQVFMIGGVMLGLIVILSFRLLRAPYTAAPLG